MASKEKTVKKAEDGTPQQLKREPPSLKTSQKIVYVKVGEQKEPFGIHLELACFHSPYLRAAFTGGFSGGRTGELVLDTKNPELFGLFVHWMYTQEISKTICTDTALTPFQKESRELPRRSELVDLWLLAEYLQVTKLQNQVLDLIRRTIRTQYNSFTMSNFVYEKTICGSMLRKFWVDLFVWSSNPAQFYVENRHRMHSEMFIDLFVAERNRRMNPPSQNPIYDIRNYLVNDVSEERKTLSIEMATENKV